MAGRTARLIATITAIAATGLASPASAGSPDGAGGAQRLARDATSSLTTAGAPGRLRFVGVRGRGRIDNPSVDAGTGVEAAARAHLKRYGDAFGADRPGTSLRAHSPIHSVSGQDVVRFDQRIDGVRVLGADVVVAMGSGGDLTSVSASLSSVEEVPPARIPEDVAATAARALIAGKKAHADLDVVSQGRTVFDPSVFGEPAPDGARTGWSFEVTGGPAVRRLVVIDDRTTAPLLNIDENHQLDRVVCDNANVQRAADMPCTASFTRTEAGPVASGDAETAFQLAGAVSELYQQVGGLDLTQLIGIPTSAGGPKLAATVNWCYTGETCPFGNAFWNGSQMYYGAGYAGADDVVGHEMTHGVIDRFSELFYWGQSGAINESLADIMGEIVDHRHPSSGDVPTDWQLGEDLPGGAVRDLADPTRFGQPDRTTSALYTDDVDNYYSDNGGVHTDSGVGNKTAYLISQGGTFNGQTITGIDADDATLNKTATLYLDVIEKLASGSDYADLAAVLDQSCAGLAAAGTARFTASDCTSVHAATAATQLRTTPTRAPQPSDAPQTCPSGTAKRVLLSSESDPTASFAGDSTWVRGASPYFGSNATSGTESWSITAPWTDGSYGTSQSLRSIVDVTLPQGQPSYLWFQGWYLLDYAPGTPADTYYDLGTVGIDTRVGGRSAGSYDAEQFPWINGPTRTPDTSVGWYTDRRGFGGDSHGWVASRVELSEIAGTTIRPEFALDTDSSYLFPGWFLDDITVYTCDWVGVVPAQGSLPQVYPMDGGVQLGGTLGAAPGGWVPRVDSYAYQWLRDGLIVPGATGDRYVLGITDVGHRMAVRVTASAAGLAPGEATSVATAPVAPGTLRPTRAYVVGRPKVGRRLRATSDPWAPAGVTLSYQWLRNGKAIARATGASYRLIRKDRGKRISVRITGRKSGYATRSVTSRRTPRIS